MAPLMTSSLALRSSVPLPPLIAQAGPQAQVRFLEFFAATIRNPNTRRAYAKAANDCLTWCLNHGVHDLGDIAPIHIDAWIETLG